MYIDFHAHILPGVDHGSYNLKNSLNQIKKAQRAGIDTIVATSHFYMIQGYQQGDQVEKFLKLRQTALEQLLPALEEQPVKIVPAAEVTIENNLDQLSGLENLCIEGTNYILLEMPQNYWREELIETVYLIKSQCHLRPIIAHVNRYAWKDISKLLELDVIFQVNAEAFMSLFSRGRYLKLIKAGLIQVLGSDAHQESIEFYWFEKAMKYLGDYGKELMKNGRAILANS